MKLSIIIINYNLSAEIEECIKSLQQVLLNITDFKWEIIIVDNNSPDKKLPEVENRYKRENINFYYLPENVGFGKGCNYGFTKASGEYICFLNPDTIIKQNIFSPFLNLLNNDKSIGIAGPKQQIKRPFFDFSAGFSPSIIFEIINLFGAGVFIEGLLVFCLAKIKRNKLIKVNWILGACIFIKSELFKKIEGFDKDYFMFFEELDLCKRVSDKGYKIIYYPEQSIHHIGSVSGKRDYRLYTIRTYSSKKIYISKHYKGFPGLVFKSLLFVQLFSQIIIWSILLPLNSSKSKQKISAFIYLIKHRMKYK
ncbi:MAG: glycosyltransferase family 2 protein [Ignavibacteriota bacterium]|nr:glycosyltransferase [Ignavibacteriota bacterium]MBW7841232.1 glycosyltransferase family 2 protein [Ignavibacterium sp.]MCO6448935.1 glycosyltransferase family 2 protein [Ignavibacterium album]MCZ2269435.1 glycosyltransferase family 2 protein [Ignavibacteriales bacterium]HOJ05974.1 glycosyltransferase family 2 protein [Ignavibacteriaceae bacterium]